MIEWALYAIVFTFGWWLGIVLSRWAFGEFDKRSKAGKSTTVSFRNKDGEVQSTLDTSGELRRDVTDPSAFASGVALLFGPIQADGYRYTQDGKVKMDKDGNVGIGGKL